jgi:glycosyltransferase involved in cell wall biosynthesis
MALARKLHALSREIAFDIIQFPEYGGEGFVYQTETFSHRTARYVVQLHGPLAMFVAHMGWPEPGSTLEQIGCFMERMAIHRADRLLASSHSTAAFCARRYDYPVGEIRVVHSAVDTARFAPRAQPEDERHPRLLFVGNLISGKGIDLLVRTVLELRARYPAVCLRAVGKPDPNVYEGLARLIDSAGAWTNFEFTGQASREELPGHFAWCDLFVAPSLYEGGPGNIYLEAMACGRPVVARDAGGVSEVVLDQQTGLLIPSRPTGIDASGRDMAALEQALVTLIEDPGLRERFGKNGRAWVEENFSVDRYIGLVERLYQELL